VTDGVIVVARTVRWFVVNQHRTDGAAPDQGALTAARKRAVRQLLRIAPIADELGATFSAAGHDIALVGGSVRDALLDRLGHDLDFTTSARPEQTEALLQGWADAIWSIGRAYGTIGARKGDFQIEITTYRADRYAAESRKPEVEYGSAIEEDLLRRDFTVNAMAVRLPERTFLDPFDGMADLARGLLRTPGTPEESFSDDPLRMLRAARFSATLGFEVDDVVRAAMTAMAERIQIVSTERVRDELSRTVLADQPRRGLELLVGTALAERVLPELPALRLEIDEHHRHKDVYEHSLTVLDQAIELEQRLERETPDLVVRLAALLHDIGKPRTRRLEANGGVSFHHHDVVGAKMTRKRLKALKYPTATIESVAQLVQLHLRFHGYGGGQWTDSAVRRYVRDAGEELDRLHVLTRADCTTRNRRKATALRRAYDDLEARIDRLAEQEEMAAVRPDLDGRAIMTILGIEPGPLVGRAYKHLLDYRLDHGPVGPAAAEAELRRWWAEQPEQPGGSA